MPSLRPWMLALLLAAACARSDAALPATHRAPGMPDDGKAAARVLLFQGAPQVVAGGRQFGVDHDLQLQKDDVLRVPAGSWLVLRIESNGYVVNVDEDLELAVRDLALLDAPATKAGIEEQLAALAASKEMGNDRVTAYQNRRMAGQSASRAKSEARKPEERKSEERGHKDTFQRPPPPSPAAAPPLKKELKAEPKLDLPSASAEPPAKSAQVARPEAEEKAKAKAKDEPRKPREEPEGSDKAALVGGPPPAAPPSGLAWELVQSGEAKLQAEPLPEAVASALGDLGDVKACVRAAWTARGLAPKADQLLLRFEGGRVVRVKLGSGLSAGSCAKALVGKPADIAGEGWIRIRLEL